MEIRVDAPKRDVSPSVPPDTSFDPSDITDGMSIDAFLYRHLLAGCFYDPIFQRVMEAGSFHTEFYGEPTNEDILVIGRFDVRRLDAVWKTTRSHEVLIATINMLAQHFDEPGVSNAYETFIPAGSSDVWLVTKGSMQFANQLFANVTATFVDNLPVDIRERMEGNAFHEPVVTFGVTMGYEAAQVVFDSFLERYGRKPSAKDRDQTLQLTVRAAQVLTSRRLWRTKMLGEIYRNVSVEPPMHGDDEPTLSYPGNRLKMSLAEIVSREPRKTRDFLSGGPAAAHAADCLFTQICNTELRELQQIVDGYTDPDRSIDGGTKLEPREEERLMFRLLEKHAIRVILQTAIQHA